MICKFCNQECKEEKRYKTSNIYRMVCDNHLNVKIEYSRNTKYLTIIGDKYTVTYYYNSVYIDETAGSHEELLHLKHDPKITPDNFEDKIKILLAFS